MTQDKELTDFQRETQRAILMDKDYYSPSEAAALNRLNTAAREARKRGDGEEIRRLYEAARTIKEVHARETDAEESLVKEALTQGRHPDFQRLYQDFIDIRGAADGPTLYHRFLYEYRLDERASYNDVAQTRLREMALKAPTHLAIKKQYPMLDWDSYITGRRKASHMKIRSDEAVKLRFKNLGRRPIRIRLGGGEI